MEILWMVTISLVALAASFIIGEKLNSTLTLRMDVRDHHKLKKQLNDIAEQGVRFAEDAYAKGLIPLCNVKPVAAEFTRNALQYTYHASVVKDSGVIEDIIENILNPGDSIGVHNS